MNNAIITNILRFIGLVLFQGLILKRLEFQVGWLEYIHPMVYPLFIMLLPLRTPAPLVVGLGFLTGLGIALFYQSLGLHASATVFLAYIRSYVFGWIEPRGGYNVNFSPTRRRFGMNWYLRYVLIMLAIHHVFYFSVEAFTFVYIWQIVFNTLFSFVVSFLFIMMYQLVFDP